MKETIGEKIKRVAKTIFIVWVIFAIIASVGITIATNGTGFGLLIVVVVLSVTIIPFYVLIFSGFGELIDKVSSIEKELKVMNNKKPDTIVSTADKQPDSVVIVDDKTEE
jgi:TRAP-type mannitol/chloroaromatic compound transport system permease small subunit